MSSELDIEIEHTIESIMTEVINSRDGKEFKDIPSIMIFVLTICSQGATLKNQVFSKMTSEEQVNIALVVLPEIYSILKSARLIPHSFEHEVDSIVANTNSLREKLQLAILTYDLTSQVTGLPSSTQVGNATVSALKTGIKIPKFKFKF